MEFQECHQVANGLRLHHLEGVLRDGRPRDGKVLGIMMNILDIMASKTHYTYSAWMWDRTWVHGESCGKGAFSPIERWVLSNWPPTSRAKFQRTELLITESSNRTSVAMLGVFALWVSTRSLSGSKNTLGKLLTGFKPVTVHLFMVTDISSISVGIFLIQYLFYFFGSSDLHGTPI